LKGFALREFLNAILSFIGTTSLTDNEFDALPIDSAAYNSATYEALAGVLQSRESVSTIKDKLYFYFKARGVEVTEVSTGRSNIFLGSVL
jgi:hypothetical protein